MRHILWLCRLSALALLLTGAIGWAQQRGHRIGRTEVLVNTRNHWQNWEFPAGTVEISTTGTVRPRQLRRGTNAVEDIVEFLRQHPPGNLTKKDPEQISLPDAIQAGSNPEDVIHVLDGDPSTYWEPDPPRNPDNLASEWWFTVDLGRLVFAKKIVVRFAQEGDPFLLFELLVTDGQKRPQFPRPTFKTVLRTLQPNRSERLFEIDLTDSEIRGQAVRLFQVLVSGSNLDRSEELAQEEYNALSAPDRGAIEYYKRLPDGGSFRVEKEVYEQLSVEQQGDVRHFRRERPRLSEVEVWSEGDEIVGGAIERGGRLSTTQPAAATGNFVDGDPNSKSRLPWGVPDPTRIGEEMQLVVDLGSHFWIDTHRMVFQGQSFAEYTAEISDGSLAPDGSLKWDKLLQRKHEITYKNFEVNTFSQVAARFFRLRWFLAGLEGSAQLAELQLYGEGFQPKVFLESDLIRLGGSRNLLSIEWQADTPPGTEVLIQTRSGSQLDEKLHYFHKDGTELTKEKYEDLLSLFRGDIIAEDVPGSDWSNWSEPYSEATGSPITSPSPREFLKIRATLLSENPKLHAALQSIRLRFVDPVVRRLVGEIAPFQVDSLGTEQVFSLYLEPQFSFRDSGFDELLLVAPSDMNLQFVGLYRNDGELAVEGVSVVPTQADSLRLSFPRIAPNQGIDLLRLDFRTALFASGAVLRPAVRNSDQGADTWQRADPGDVLAAVQGNTTTIVSTLKIKKLITGIEVQPLVFTPNGDGINDEVIFSFRVTRLSSSSPVEVTVYDLSGRAVRHLAEQRPLSTGSYAIGWDGRDSENMVVPPGIYFARLQIAANTFGAVVGDETVVRSIGVSY